MRLSIVARRKPDKDKTLPLYVRIAQGGVDRYVSLSLRVPAADWNARKRELRTGAPHAAQLNAHLAERLATAQAAAHDVVASGREVTADRLKDGIAAALAPESDAPEAGRVTVKEYGEGVVEEFFADGKASSAYHKQQAFRAFEESAPGVAFDAVTPAVVRAHVARLRAPKGAGGRSLAPNTVYSHLSTLKALARKAAREGVPGAEGAVRALTSVRVRREKTEKPRLPLEAVERMAALTATSEPPLPRGYGETARDAFVLAFYAGGMRWGDVCTLRWERIGRRGTVEEPMFESLAIRQRKSGELSRLPILGHAAEILERWWKRTGPGGEEPGPFVFGLVEERDFEDARHLRHVINRRGALIRQHLYVIQARLGLPQAGFHSARHAFADHMRRRGAGLYAISKALGHSSLTVTEAYLRSFDAEGVEAAMRDAFDKGGPSV